MKNKQWSAREFLRKYHDGLSTSEIAHLLNHDTRSTYKLLQRMPDAYIDRWRTASRGQYDAIWRVVVPPANCPHPTRHKAANDSYIPTTVWIEVRRNDA